MAKRRRGGRDGPRRSTQREQRPHQEQKQRPQKEQRRYLILDDDPFGYSIRQISLSPPTSRQTRSSRKNTAAGPVRRLPQPIFHMEARRGLPSTFAAIGTKIVVTQSQCMNHLFRGGGGDMVFIQIYDVRHRCVTLGPGLYYDARIYIPVGDNLFALSSHELSKLSFEPKQPPPLDALKGRDDVPWSWHKLPPPPFDMVDANSYAVLPDGQTILVSADVWPDDDPCSVAGTFSFDTRALVWEKHGDWTLPFTGCAYFVHCLQAFVGLSKDPATYLALGRLTSCEAATRPAAACKLGKEKLFSDDPAETHVSARLVYTGRGGGSEFCLVQCVSVKPKPGNGNADDKNLDEPRSSRCYRYRLTTFSLSYDDNGDLTIGETSRVQCYEVPRETTEQFIVRGDPVAFWL